MRVDSPKVLVISQVYYPDTVSVAQHLYDLTEELVKSGYDVTVITSKRNYENPKIKYSSKEKIDNIKVVRIMSSGFGKKFKIGRLIDFITFNLSITMALTFRLREKYEFVLGLTAPPLLSFIGVIFSKRFGAKFMYWAMDLQPELAIISGYVKNNSGAARLLQKTADFIYRNSDLIFALDVYMRSHIISRVPESKVVVRPVWPVVPLFFNCERLQNPFRLRNNFGNRIVIMYSGNHSLLHPLTTLIEAAIVLKNDDRFLFVHIGGGVGLELIKDAVTSENLKNIVILPFQPRSEIHFSLHSSDLQVISLGQNCVGFTHPNKIYGSMFVGRPLIYIGPEESHVTNILNELPGNIAVKHGESRQLVIELENFASKSEASRNEIGNRNREYILKYFNPSILRNQMVQCFEDMVN